MKRRISSLATLVVVLLVLIVPMFAFTASAAETEATLSFASTAQRTSLSASQQVWEQNGIIFTNNKASSTTAVADYSKPARLYAGSSVEIEAPGNITKIVFDCNSSSYATAMKNSIGTAATVSVSSDKVTVELDGTSNSFTVAKLTAQVRLDSLTVTYTTGPACEHKNQTTTNTATCTENGEIIVTCNDCSAVISSETSLATGHVNTTTTTTDATCTEAGSTTVKCNDCGATVSTTPIPATGHNYVDNKCTNCGEALAVYSYSLIGPESTESYTSVGGNVVMPGAPTLSGLYQQIYVFVGWSESRLDDTTSAPELLKAGDTVVIDEDTTFYAVYTYSSVTVIENKYTQYSQYTGALTAGNYLVTYNNGAMKAYVSSNRLQYSDITVSGNVVTSPIDPSTVWAISQSGSYWTLYNSSTGMYAGGSGSKNTGVLTASITDNTKWTVSGTSTYDFTNLGHSNKDINATLRRNSTYGFACYATSTGGALTLYKETVVTESETITTTFYTTTLLAEDVPTTCEHTNTSSSTTPATCINAGSTTVTCDDCGEVVHTDVIDATGHVNTTTSTVDATCDADGSTTVTCNDCGKAVSTEILPKLEHSYENGTCTLCGKSKPSDPLDLDGKEFYIAAIRNSGNYFYMTNDLGTASTKRYTAIDSGSTSLPQSITNKDNAYVFIFEYIDENNYYIYTYTSEGLLYLGYTSGNSGTLVDKASAQKFTIKETDDGKYVISLTTESRNLELNLSNNYFAFYGGTQISNLALIPVSNETCEHTNIAKTITLYPTCTENGVYTVVCADCGNALPAEPIPALGHSLVDEVCIKCNYTDAPVDPVDGSWELVTDVSTLKPGDKIIIVSKESNAALSTNQKDSNRGQASVSKDGNYVTFYYDTQILTLQAGNIDGTFAFYTGSGYLYAASDGSNHLKTETTLSDNGSWIITIEADGTATIKAKGENSRNWLRYNSSSSLFSCYESGQKDVVIYKLEQEGEDTAELYAASMTVGSNLAMNFYVSGAIGSDYRMTFTINGAVYEVTSSKQSNGYLVFTFANIPPQMMGDTITAKLYKSGSDTVLDEVETSVKEYAEKVIELYPDNETLMNLIADMLKYGAAAQKYVEYKEDELVTDGIDLTGKGSTADPTIDDNHRSMTTEEGTEIDKSVYSFTAAGVRFDFDNKIYVKFKATGDATISLKCNGKYATKEDLGNGTYIFYTDGIDAYSFDEVYTFELYVDNALHQTLTYSVNSYAYAKFTDEQTTAVDELALALYRYGLSAKEYTGR